MKSEQRHEGPGFSVLRRRRRRPGHVMVMDSSCFWDLEVWRQPRAATRGVAATARPSTPSNNSSLAFARPRIHIYIPQCSNHDGTTLDTFHWHGPMDNIRAPHGTTSARLNVPKAPNCTDELMALQYLPIRSSLSAKVGSGDDFLTVLLAPGNASPRLRFCTSAEALLSGSDQDAATRCFTHHALDASFASALRIRMVASGCARSQSWWSRGETSVNAEFTRSTKTCLRRGRRWISAKDRVPREILQRCLFALHCCVFESIDRSSLFPSHLTALLQRRASISLSTDGNKDIFIPLHQYHLPLHQYHLRAKHSHNGRQQPGKLRQPLEGRSSGHRQQGRQSCSRERMPINPRPALQNAFF